MLDEDQSRTLLEKNVEELMMVALRRRHPGALHLAGARGLRGGTYREGAVDIVVRLVTELQRLGKDSDWLRKQTATTCRTVSEEAATLGQCASRVVELVEELRWVALPPESKAAERIRQLESQWPRYRRVLESFNAASSRGDSGRFARILRDTAHRANAEHKGYRQRTQPPDQEKRQASGFGGSIYRRLRRATGGSANARHLRAGGRYH